MRFFVYLHTQVKPKAESNAIEFSEDRAWFGRMLIVSKSRPDVDLKEVLGTYELSIIPRSMFAQDGTMLHCSQKSDLMRILVDYLPKEDAVTHMCAQINDTIITEHLTDLVN